MPRTPQTERRSGTSAGSGADPCDGCRLIQEADHRIANHLAMLAASVRLKELELARGPAVPSADPACRLGLILGGKVGWGYD